MLVGPFDFVDVLHKTEYLGGWIAFSAGEVAKQTHVVVVELFGVFDGLRSVFHDVIEHTRALIVAWQMSLKFL